MASSVGEDRAGRTWGVLYHGRDVSDSSGHCVLGDFVRATVFPGEVHRVVECKWFL